MLNSIMLIDDNNFDNFYHERIIKKSEITDNVITKRTGIEALEYLKTQENNIPDLIFLDINMPGMNGWEFLENFGKLNEVYRYQIIIVMLTTSNNPDDKNRTKEFDMVAEYITKPLTKEVLSEVVNKFF